MRKFAIKLRRGPRSDELGGFDKIIIKLKTTR